MLRFGKTGQFATIGFSHRSWFVVSSSGVCGVMDCKQRIRTAAAFCNDDSKFVTYSKRVLVSVDDHATAGNEQVDRRNVSRRHIELTVVVQRVKSMLRACLAKPQVASTSASSLKDF